MFLFSFRFGFCMLLKHFERSAQLVKDFQLILNTNNFFFSLMLDVENKTLKFYVCTLVTHYCFIVIVFLIEINCNKIVNIRDAQRG